MPTIGARQLQRLVTAVRRLQPLPRPVSFRLVGDAEMRELNRRFRGQDKPTDVLSFPGTGDIVISLDTATRQAAEQGHAAATEVRILLLHGLLHLAGYDHESDSGEMARRERRLRRALGLPQGMIERAGKE